MASFRLVRGGFALEVDLEAPAGATTVVVGPNGAGKTTLLRALAGLEAIDDGRITLGTRVFDDPAAGCFVAPSDRGLGVVFQRHALFPHLRVLDNVAFGLRSGGMSRAAARAAAADQLAALGIAGLAARQPGTLSGGEAQRVALARALVTDPMALLLDEPFAALDVSAREAVRRVLAHSLAVVDGPRLIVTHDPSDAVVLADRVVVLERGRVVQSGPLGDLAGAPASAYVADLVGTNRLVGRLVSASTVEVADGLVLTGTAPEPEPSASPSTGPGEPAVFPAATVGARAVAVVPPRSVALPRHRPEGSPRNVWPARVEVIDDHLGRVRVRLGGPAPVVAEITPEARAQLRLRPGDEIWASVKASEVTVHRS